MNIYRIYNHLLHFWGFCIYLFLIFANMQCSLQHFFFFCGCINHLNCLFYYNLSAFSLSHHLFLFTLHFQTTRSVVPLPEARTSIHSIGSLGSPIHSRRPTISFLFTPDYLKNLSWWYFMVHYIYAIYPWILQNV